MFGRSVIFSYFFQKYPRWFILKKNYRHYNAMNIKNIISKKKCWTNNLDLMQQSNLKHVPVMFEIHFIWILNETSCLKKRLTIFVEMIPDWRYICYYFFHIIIRLKIYDFILKFFISNLIKDARGESNPEILSRTMNVLSLSYPDRRIWYMM